MNLGVVVCYVAMLVGHVIPLGIHGDYSGARLGIAYTSLFFIAIASQCSVGPLTACKTTPTSSPVAVVQLWAHANGKHETGISSNTAPSGRRAISMAFHACMANFGGIVGSFMYLDRETPAYTTGFTIGTVFAVVGMMTTLLLWRTCVKRNQAMELRSEDDVRGEYSDDELLQLGNDGPLFKYTV